MTEILVGGWGGQQWAGAWAHRRGKNSSPSLKRDRTENRWHGREPDSESSTQGGGGGQQSPQDDTIALLGVRGTHGDKECENLRSERKGKKGYIWGNI